VDIKTTIPISEARRRIFEIREELRTPGRYYTLTEKGKPVMVMLSAEEFESLIGTLEVMHDSPNLKKNIMESEREYAKGEYITLEEMLKEEGISISYQKSKNALPRRRPQKSKKINR